MTSPGSTRAAKKIDSKVLRYESRDIEKNPVEWIAQAIDDNIDVAALIEALRNLTNAISDNFCSLCGKTKAEGGHSKFCPMVEAEAVLKVHGGGQ